MSHNRKYAWLSFMLLGVTILMTFSYDFAHAVENRDDILHVDAFDLRGGQLIQDPAFDVTSGTLSWDTARVNIVHRESGGPDGGAYTRFQSAAEDVILGGRAGGGWFEVKPNREYVLSLVVRKHFEGEILVGLSQFNDRGMSVYNLRNGIPEFLPEAFEDNWFRFEVVVPIHPEARYARLSMNLYTDGALDVADIKLIELPPAELTPYARGEGVTFAGGLGNLPIYVEEPHIEDDSITLKTTGSVVRFNLSENEIEFHQRVEKNRQLAVADVSVPLAGLEVLESDEEKVVLANDYLTFGLQADGLLFFSPQQRVTVNVQGLFAGEWNQFSSGHLLSIDDFGGISVNPDIPQGTGRLARAEFIEGEKSFPYPEWSRTQAGSLSAPRERFFIPWDEDGEYIVPESDWVARWDVSPGERLAISVFPPRPFDWDKAMKEWSSDRIVFSGTSPVTRMEQLAKEERVNTYGFWSHIFSYKIGGGHGGSSGHVEIRSELHDSLVRDRIQWIQDNDARSIVYISPWFYYSHDKNVFFKEMKRITDEYGFDGVYWDGSYPLNWVETYELVRMTRELFPYGEGYIYHHSTGQVGNGGYPLARPGMTIPALDTYSDRMYRGEHVIMDDPNDIYPKYIASGFRTSNTIGELKSDDWDIPFGTKVLKLLSHVSDIGNFVTWDAGLGLTKEDYFSMLDSLYKAWQEHGDSETFYDEVYLPMVNEFAARCADGCPVLSVYPGQILFLDDFSEDRIGNFPAKWSLASGQEENVTVVSVDDFKFDRAIHIFADKNEDTFIRAYGWDPDLEHASKISVEFWTKHSTNNYTTNIGLFRTAPINYTAVFLPGGRNITAAGKKWGELKPNEWNHFRALIDLKENIYELQVNDESLGSFDFRRPLESWSDTQRFYFDIETRGNAEKSSEAYYTGFDIRVIE